MNCFVKACIHAGIFTCNIVQNDTYLFPHALVRSGDSVILIGDVCGVDFSVLCMCKNGTNETIRFRQLAQQTSRIRIKEYL